jgi:hypothetical protein
MDEEELELLGELLELLLCPLIEPLLELLGVVLELPEAAPLWSLLELELGVELLCPDMEPLELLLGELLLEAAPD